MSILETIDPTDYSRIQAPKSRFIFKKWGINRLFFVLSVANLTHKVADISTKNINHTQFFFNLFAFTVFLLALN